MNCELCGKRPVTQTYEFSGRTSQLCDQCFDRSSVQDAFEARLVEIELHAMAGRISEALAVLDELLALYLARDHDGWLRRSVLSHRAMILHRHGDLQGALAAQQAAIDCTADPRDRVQEWVGLAVILEQLGRLTDAGDAIARAIDDIDSSSRHVQGAPSVLARYLRLRPDGALPPRAGVLLERAATEWGIEQPATPDELSLRAAITAVDQTIRLAAARYEALGRELAELRRQPDADSRVAAALRAYISTEPVGFYRFLAQDKLAVTK